MSVRISAVVCTFNRTNYLRKAIRSLVEQTLFRDHYDILVVDNGSTDNTREVVLREFSNVQSLRYLYEPILGVSQARNTGWANAAGEYVAYLDDDAIVSPQWLEKILNVFETVKPKPGCVGGKVEPIWEVPRPPWLSDEIVPYLTTVDWSKTPIALNDTQWLAGTNIAFPRSLLEVMGGFQVDLGRKGSKLLSMEEILLQRQLQSKGYDCFYHPEISVGHHMQASRLAKGWFFKRVYWQGVCEAMIQIQRESPSAMERFRMGISRAWRILLSRRQLSNLTLPTNNPRRFAQKCFTMAQVGNIFGLWGIAK